MLEGLITLLGGGLGGLLRLAPEVLKWLDKKNDRAHELAMFDKQLEADKLKSGQRIAEADAVGQIGLDGKGLDALIEGIKAQGQMTGVRWVDGFNQLIRPTIAFQWVIVLYPAVIIATFYLLITGGTPPGDALAKVFGPEEKAFVAGIANFFFMNRVLRNRG